MPTYTITAPNGKQYRMTGPAGLSMDAQIEHVMGFDPDAMNPPPPPKTGVLAALSGAGENWLASSKAGVKGIYDPQGAAEELQASQEATGRRYDPETGLKRVGDVYDKDGLLSAGKEVFRQLPNLTAQMAPSLGAGWAGAKAGSRFGIPGVIGGGALGALFGGAAANYPAQIGENLGTQQEERAAAIKRGETPDDISYGKAAATAVPQAALEMLGPLKFMGKSVAAKLFGKEAADLVRTAGPEAAEEVAKRSFMAQAGRGAGSGFAGEGLTEAGQAALTRLQAGKPLLSDEALMEYGESIYSGGAPGAAIGAVGHTLDRSSAQSEMTRRQQEASALAGQQGAEAQAAAEQAQAAREQAEAQALVRRQADPDYAMQVGQEYAAFEQQRKDMMTRAAALRKDGTVAGKQESRELAKAAYELTKEKQPLIDAFKATRAAREALSAGQLRAGAPTTLALPAPEVDPNAERVARVQALQDQIAEHEEAIPTAAATVRSLIQGGSSADLNQANEALNQRKAGLKSAWRELNRLDPTISQQRLQQQEQQSAAAAREADLESFDPAKVQQEIVELTAARQRLGQKEGNATKAGPIIARMEELQSLLDEHESRAPLRAARELWGRELPAEQQREQGPQAPLRLEGPQAPLLLEGPTPERRAADTDAAFNRTFAPTSRSPVLDLSEQGVAGDLLASEGAAISEALQAIPAGTKQERKAKGRTAQELQAHAATIKQALQTGRDAARAAGDKPRIEAFTDAIRRVTALEQRPDNPGRAHYEAEFYDITAPLVPGVVQGAREVLGLPARSRGVHSARGKEMVGEAEARQRERLGRVDDPALTEAMQSVADEGMDEDVGLPKKQPGRPGTVREREEVREPDESGQGFLFTPEAPPAATADTPRQVLAQRVAGLLANQRLTAQARSRLEKAADILGPARPDETRIEQRKPIDPKVAARIKATRAQLEERLQDPTLKPAARMGMQRGLRQLEDAAEGRDVVPAQQAALSEQVMEAIRHTVEQAEKGHGRDIGYPPAPTPPAPREDALKTKSGSTVYVDDEGRLQYDTRAATVAVTAPKVEREKITVPGRRRKFGGPAREVPGTAAVTTDEGGMELVEQTAEVRRGRTQGPSATDEQAQARKAAAEARARADVPDLARRKRETAQTSTSPVATRDLEQSVTDEDPEFSRIDQGDLFASSPASAAATPQATFTRIRDRATARVKALSAANDKLVSQAIGLRLRVADAAKAKVRMQKVSQELTQASPAYRKERTDQLRAELLKATQEVPKVSEALARNELLARDFKAAGNTESQKRHERNADRLLKELAQRMGHVEELKLRLQAFSDVDAAPSIAAAAQNHDALVAEAQSIDKELARNKAEIAVQNKNVMRARKRLASLAQAAPRTGGITHTTVGGRSLAEQEAARKAKARDDARAAERAADDAAAEKAAADRRIAAASSGSEYTTRTGKEAAIYAAKEKPDESIAVAVEDLAAAALRTPGVIQAALDAAVKRIDKYKTAKAFTDTAGKVSKRISAIEDQQQKLRDANRGGDALSPPMQARYEELVALRDQQEEAIENATTAAARDKLTKEMHHTDRRIKAMDATRTPVEESKAYRALETEKAVKTFELRAIDARATQLRIDSSRQARSLKLKREIAAMKQTTVRSDGVLSDAQKLQLELEEDATVKFGELDAEQLAQLGVTLPAGVEPGVLLNFGQRDEEGNLKPLTKMDITAQTRQQKTPFQGKGFAPTVQMEEAAAANKGTRVAVENALAEARAAKSEKLGKPAKLTPLQTERIVRGKTPVQPTAEEQRTTAKSRQLTRPATDAEVAAEKAAARAAKAAREEAEKKAAKEAEEKAAYETQEAAKYARSRMNARLEPLIVELARRSKDKTLSADAREDAAELHQLAVDAKTGKVSPRVQALLDTSVEQLSATSGASIGTREELFGDHGVGNLDYVLETLETTGSTPLVRELARKLRPLVKKTALVYTDNPKAAGSFLPGLDRIRLGPKGLTEHTLLHEGTHAATLRTLLAPEGELTREQRNARRGLEALLKQLQNDPSFTGDYGAVNLGELASEIMTNQKLRDKINAKKPGFWARFKAAVMQMLGMQPARWMNSKQAMAEVEKMFEPSREFTDAELAAAAQEKARSMPRIEAYKAYKATLPKELPEARAKQLRGLLKDVMEEPEVSFEHIPMGEFSAMNTAPEKLRGIAGAKAMVNDINAGLSAEYAFVDQRAPILKALSKAEQVVYRQAEYFLRKADARMAQVYSVLMHGPAHLKRDAKGNHIVEAGNGPSIKTLFDQIGKLPGETAAQKLALAQSYMVAKRAANKGWDSLGWETGAAKQAVAERELAQVNANPALKAQLDGIAKTYNDFNRGQVQFLVDTQAITKAEGQRLMQDNDYVPFYRVGGTGTAELVLGDGKSIKVGDIRRQPHLKKLVGDETKLMPLSEAVMRNTMLLTDMGLQNLTAKNIAYALQGMGRGKGPKGKDGKATNINVIHSGEAPAGADIITFSQEPDAGEEGPNAGKRWMRVESAGTAFEGIPPELLVKSLEGSHLMMSEFGKFGAMFGDILRKGVTRSPMYVLRQLIRDPMSAAFTAGTTRGPLAATFEAMREFTAQTKGTSKDAETLLKKGVTQSGIFTGDDTDLSLFAKQLMQGDQSAFSKLMAMADRAAMRADSATRTQVYNDALKATGSEMQAELAAMEMMNFSKRGGNPHVQQAARMIPFMNAQIQGLNVLVKAMRGQMPHEESMRIREKLYRRGMGLAAMTMVYALGMEDNEEYKNATAQDRFNNFFVPTPFGTIRVPIPYEVGLLFKVLPEALARGMQGSFDETDLAAMKKLGYNAIPGATSLGIPQAGKPVLELLMNSNIYTGKPIESERQQMLDPAERFNDSTTELAKTIGGALGMSPLKIEHLVRGYFGGLPLGVASLTNELFADKNTPDRRASQMPVFGGLIADPLARGAVDRAYAKSNAIKQAGATYDKLIADGKLAAAQKYKEDNLNVLMADPVNDNFNRFMTNIRKQRASLMQSGLQGAELRRNLDYLDKAQIERANMFTDAVKAIVTAH